MKTLPRTTLILYLLVLLWLVLFKFSYDLAGVLQHYQSRSLNLVPFAGYARGGSREMVDNLLVFIPFGLLLGANLKQTGLGRKLAAIFAFSLAIEALQFVFAIGTTDITDVITNTAGGLLGLVIYDVGKRYIGHKSLDWTISVVVMTLLVVVVLLRTLMFRVRY